GVLLGREFFEIVAPRRMDFKAVRQLRRKHRIKLFVSGIVIALLFTVPLVNLIAPIVATAFMVHIFHGLRGSGNQRRELRS
ncbi:MAG: EI24 domain-containing protein, partial [Alphaproteobacteria bacterium]